MASPRLIVVGADKGGVGKTVLSRLLLRRLPPGSRAVDTEGKLRRFYPDAMLIDATKTDDQIRLFDSMPAVTLVDVRAGLLSELLGSMRDMALLDDVSRGALALTVVHVLGPNSASLEEVAPTAAVLGRGAQHVLVKNYVSAGAQFFDFNPEAVRKYLGDMAVVEVTHLDDRVAEAVDDRAQTYDAFVADEANSLVLRRKLAHWLFLTGEALGAARVDL
jgi:hypothetical protein